MEERKSRYEQSLEEEEKPQTKRCSKCKNVKALGEFGRRKNRLGTSWCRDCTSEKHRKYKSREDRFWKFYHAHTTKIGACIEWGGGYSSDKRPILDWNGHSRNVRSIVYELLNGKIHLDMHVIPTCKNNRCVRQSHIGLVSKSIASISKRRDAAIGERNGQYTHPDRKPCADRHGRYTKPDRTARGSGHGMSKLDENSVRAIRDLHKQGVTRVDLGKRFGVSAGQIWQIVRYKRWKHVE